MLRELSRSYLTIVKDLSRVLAFAACSFQWRNLRHSEEPVGPIVIHGIEGYVSDDECNGDRQPSASMTAMSSAFIDLALART